MLKKMLMVVLIGFLVGQANLFALQNKESLYDTKDKDMEVKKNKKGFAVGFEGGVANNNYYKDFNGVNDWVYTANGRLGLNMAGGKIKDGQLSKVTHEMALGYIFVDNSKEFGEGHGAYFHTALHRNIKLGKKGANYFYTGYGIGIDMIFYQGDRADLDVQFARIPVGFKFLVQESVEVFLEYTFSVGMRFVEYYAGAQEVNGNYYETTSYYLSINNEVKLGVRWWF